MNLLKRNNREEIMFKAGEAEAEKKLIPIWRQKLSDLENEKDEEIEALKFEINKLEIQLKSWRVEHEKSIERETIIRQRESKVKRDENNIKRFKEEVREELSTVMAKNQEKFQSVLRLIGNGEFIENLEDKK